MPQRKASRSASSAKRRKFHEQPTNDLDDVLVFFRQSSDLDADEHLKDLLANGGAYALSQYKSERHEFYSQVVNQVGHVLEELVAKTQTDTAETQYIKDNADSIKAEYKTKLENTVTSLSRKTGLLTQEESIKAEREETVKYMKNDLTDKMHVLDLLASELGVIEKTQADFQRKKVVYEALRDSTQESKILRQKLQTVKPFLKQASIEDSLLTATLSALTKKGEDRGSFCRVAIATADERISTLGAKCVVEVHAKRSERDLQQRVVDQALKEFETSDSILCRTNEELEDIEAEIEGLKSGSEALKRKINSHAKDISKNKGEHEKHQNKLNYLHEIYAKFAALRERDSTELDSDWVMVEPNPQGNEQFPCVTIDSTIPRVVSEEIEW